MELGQRCLLTLRENLVAPNTVLAAHAAEGLTSAGYSTEVRIALATRFKDAPSDR